MLTGFTLRVPSVSRKIINRGSSLCIPFLSLFIAKYGMNDPTIKKRPVMLKRISFGVSRISGIVTMISPVVIKRSVDLCISSSFLCVMRSCSSLLTGNNIIFSKKSIDTVFIATYSDDMITLCLNVTIFSGMKNMERSRMEERSSDRREPRDIYTSNTRTVTTLSQNI